MLTAVVFAGAVVAGVALAAAFARARASRLVEPGIWPPLTGSEPPAIANLLVHDFTLTRDAVAATLLDLAARGHLRVEEVGPGSLVCRLHGPEPTGLTAYEQQVYDTMRDACSNGSVPVEVLTREIHHQPRRWRTTFERAVLDDARTCELIEPRWTRMSATLLVFAVLGVVVAAAAVVTAAGSGGHDAPWTIPVVIAWFGVYVVCYVPDWLVDGGRQRGRPAGRAAAARWLGVRRQLAADASFPDLPPTAVAIWKRYLAYGVALGIAHSASTALPLGDDDRPIAWSAATGSWRRVHIRYPRFVPPAWGRAPARAVVAGLATTALGVWLVVVLWRPSPPHPDPPLSTAAADVVGSAKPLLWVAAALLLAWGIPVLVGALVDLRGARTVIGQVVCTRQRLGPWLWPAMPRLPTRCFIALDEGEGDRLRAYRVAQDQYDSVVERQLVTMRITPRLGHVVAIDYQHAQTR